MASPDAITWSGLARHTLGIILLAVTVLLWTASSFLASTIFADDTYSKPYFVTYVTTSLFSIYLVIRALARLLARGLSFRGAISKPAASTDLDSTGETETFLGSITDDARRREASASPSVSASRSTQPETASAGRLDVRATVRLALEFGGLWFLANFFQSKSLEYTSVASATILFSTSPLWTLAYGGWLGVETFTVRKVVGALASLAGVALIALGDLSGSSDSHRGTFPHKTPAEIAAGDVLAVLSAALYGVYTTRFKQRVGDESRVDMLLFLGSVGVLNAVCLWPGFFVLDWTGWETFEWPTGGKVQEILGVNAAISVVSDLTWAYAVVLTTPLVVTVGLSLSIPLSLLGQILVNAQGSSVTNWIGAAVVLVAFVVVNREERETSEAGAVRNRVD